MTTNIADQDLSRNIKMCPICGEPTEVYNSRPSGATLWRRRKCPQEHRFTTFELSKNDLDKVKGLVVFMQGQMLDDDIGNYCLEQFENILRGEEPND